MRLCEELSKRCLVIVGYRRGEGGSKIRAVPSEGGPKWTHLGRNGGQNGSEWTQKTPAL